MATTTTYSFNLPTVGGSEDVWGTQLNNNWSALDDLLDGTTIITGGPVLDTATTLVDSVDTTKVLDLDLSGITTGTTRTITMIDADVTIVGTSNTQTLTNKTIDPASNTIDGDVLDITFTPSNYTPDASPAEASDVDDLAAHLKGIDSQFAAVAGPNMVFLATTDASSDATLDFTAFDGTSYDAYVFVLQNIVPSTSGSNLLFRTSTDGGSTFDDGASDYEYNTNGSPGTSSTTDSSIGLGFTVDGNSSRGLSGNVWVYGPHLSKNTVVSAQVAYTTGSAGDMLWRAFGGRRNDNTAVDAVRFLFDAGNIASGTITMYGLVNSA